MFENVRNHCRTLNADEHFDLAVTMFTNFHVNIKHPTVVFLFEKYLLSAITTLGDVDFDFILIFRGFRISLYPISN